jgi:hypothetical protein
MQYGFIRFWGKPTKYINRWTNIKVIFKRQRKGGNMKRISRMGLLLLILGLLSCGGKQSSVEGKLIDWNGNPVVGVKMIATQIKPLKGYERKEAVIDSEGNYVIKGLFPLSRYTLTPWSDKWTCQNVSKTIESAPEGETLILSGPMVIRNALSKTNGSLVIDLNTGETRFLLTTDGAIVDSEEGYEWLVGPDKDLNYEQAVEWVSSVSKSGWRMPDGLVFGVCQKGVGMRNMDPIFKMSGRYIWLNSSRVKDQSWAWAYDLTSCVAGVKRLRSSSYSFRALAVRSQKKRD